jgi:hypothetical protein
VKPLIPFVRSAVKSKLAEADEEGAAFVVLDCVFVC